MASSLPAVHLLTCPQREAMCGETLARWIRTDWPTVPRVHLDSAPEEAFMPWGSSARSRQLTNAYAAMLKKALAPPGFEGDWLLFLADDLDFHPRIASHLAAWAPLQDDFCVLASLFNPGLRPRPNFPALPQAFAAESSSFAGAQALLLRRGAAEHALEQWPGLTGTPDQRLARSCGADSPIWVHRPSLVQHMAKDSSWGAPVRRAADFDPK